MKLRKYRINDYPAILDIYSRSTLDELRFEEKVFELLPLENDNNRLTELKESNIYDVNDALNAQLQIRINYFCHTLMPVCV